MGWLVLVLVLVLVWGVVDVLSFGFATAERLWGGLGIVCFGSG